MTDAQQIEKRLSIRRAVIDDAAALARLAEDTFRRTFAQDNNPQDMADHCAVSYGPDIQRAQIVDPDIDSLVVSDEEGRLVAYAQLRQGAPPAVTSPAPIELWRFYVDASHHGRGLAQRLMAAVIDAALARSARTLWLGVWERNHRARTFYRKSGFVDVGSHSFLLGRDLQTDLVMARPIG
jgi:diamine N-acetyltransferase